TAIPLADFFRLAGQAAPVTGLAYASAQVRGPAASPLVNGTFRLDSGSVQGVKLTQLQGTLAYRGGRFTADARALLAHGGGITARAELPLSLALGLPPSWRILSTGNVVGSLVADTVPLALLASITDQVTNASGSFSASMSLSGTSEQPVLAGTAELRAGALTIPAARQRYSNIQGRLTLRDRRILVDSVRARSDGYLTLGGTVEFPELRNPVANLTVTLDRFRPLGTADNPQAAAWGQIAITGPLSAPTIRGSVRLDEGNILVPVGGTGDVVTEAGVLGVADLMPAPGEETIPAAPLSNRLRLDGLQLNAGPNLWFEIPDARVQLSGTLTVDKAPDEPMLVTGTLSGQRGTYTVVAGPLVRRLDVTQARIRFLGTPELNPEIDAVATKTILDPQGRSVDIQARLTGTLDNPQLALSTAEGLQIPQSELLSFLVFGQPSFALGGTGVGQSLLQQTVFGGITEVASMQLQQSLMASGLPLDVFEIQPAQQGLSRGGLAASNLVVGRELAPDVFLTVQTAIGVLFGNTGTTSGSQLGARLEWRATPRLNVTLGYEPVTPATTLHGFFTTIPQQLRQEKQWTIELRRRWTY
ncbi:MAG TPA: translocation/assembly module TamB domain-containing protein, partial [Longimicrobiales bacterium]